MRAPTYMHNLQRARLEAVSLAGYDPLRADGHMMWRGQFLSTSDLDGAARTVYPQCTRPLRLGQGRWHPSRRMGPHR